MPGRAAHLTEERRLLIAGDAGDRHLSRGRATWTSRRRRRSTRAPSGSIDARARRTARSSSSSHVERVDVEQHRARGVADVGHMLASAGELPDQPGVDGAEREPAGARPVARAGDVVENPANLAGGEVGVDEQPGLLLDHRPCAVGLEPFAELRRAPILPDDGVVDRLAGVADPRPPSSRAGS